MTELCPINALAQKWYLAYFVPIDGHFDQWLEILTSNLFCPSLTLTLVYKPSLKSIRPKLAILSLKTSKTHQSGHISKLHFAQVSFTKKPTSPKFFHGFFWNVQNQCKYGFCTYDFWFRGLQKSFEPSKLIINSCTKFKINQSKLQA